MKAIPLCLFGCMLIGCTPRPSQETSSQDTTSAKLTFDSVSTVSTGAVETPNAPPLVISDSSASALNDLVNAQFEKFYADSVNYYKVSLTEYYDEYEGQDEMKISKWYYNKDFSVVYSWHSLQNGAMEKPDIDECLIQDEKIVCAKGDYGDDMEDREYVRWDVHEGGASLIWSPYDKKITSAKAMPPDYITLSQKAWDANVKSLSYELDKEKIVADDGIMITILTKTPKPAELMDYTKVDISKVLFDKLNGED